MGATQASFNAESLNDEWKQITEKVEWFFLVLVVVGVWGGGNKI